MRQLRVWDEPPPEGPLLPLRGGKVLLDAIVSPFASSGRGGFLCPVRPVSHFHCISAVIIGHRCISITINDLALRDYFYIAIYFTDANGVMSIWWYLGCDNGSRRVDVLGPRLLPAQ